MCVCVCECGEVWGVCVGRGLLWRRGGGVNPEMECGCLGGGKREERARMRRQGKRSSISCYITTWSFASCVYLRWLLSGTEFND